MKDLGYSNAFKGGLSFSLGDIVVPVEKKAMIAQAIETVDEIRLTITWVLLQIQNVITR
jgi:DNA-directed RNA polymerase subunit beta'